MKKVTIIFPGWIKAPNGAARFVFGLRSCINDFANQGIGLSTFTLDDVHGLSLIHISEPTRRS